MSSNYMQEAGLGIKNYSFLCQAVSTFADVLIMALQGYIQTNPSPKERQCIKELIKDAKMHEGTVNKDKNEDGRKPTDVSEKKSPFIAAVPSYAAAMDIHKAMDNADIPSVSVMFDVTGLEPEELPSDLREQVEAFGFDETGKVPLIVVPSGWEKEAQEIIDAYRIQHMPPGEQSLYDIAKFSNYNVRSISDLSETQTMVMKQFLKEADVRYAIEGPSDGKYRINFAAFDTKKVKAATELADHAMHHGKYSELLKKNLEWESKKAAENLYEIKRGEHKDGTPLERRSAYVDRNGSSIEIQKNRIKYISPNGTEKVYRRTDDAKRMNNIIDDLMINKMDHPVSLTADEYVRYKELRAMNKPVNDLLVDAERRHGHPVFTDEEIAVIAKASREKEEIVSSKLSQATHGSDRDSQNPYVEAQSFWSFKDEETRNFEEVFDMYEKDQSDGIYQGDDVRDEEGRPGEDMEEDYISDIEIEDNNISPEYMEAEFGLEPEKYKTIPEQGIDNEVLDQMNFKEDI